MSQQRLVAFGHSFLLTYTYFVHDEIAAKTTKYKIRAFTNKENN